MKKRTKTIGSQVKCKHKWRYLAEKYPDDWDTCQYYWCSMCGSLSEYYLDQDEGEMVYVVVGTPSNSIIEKPPTA